MPAIRADNLTLIHPVHGKTSSTAQAGETPRRLVFDKNGRLRGVRALDDVSFRLGKGARVGLVGKNGSGKTTLLRVLAGIITPDEGEVEIEGRATNLININLGTKDDASGHRNITLQGLAHGRSRAEIEEQRARIAEFSDLGAFLDLPVNTYSSGMRMRLSFAIATAFRPEILLLDEWLSAGDESFRRKASQRMARFVEHAGILVMASHSKSLLEANCETAIWLDEGKVQLQGPVAEVFEAYKDYASGATSSAEENVQA